MNKTAFVTGASRGIGKAVARALAQSGMNVIIGYNKTCFEAENLASELVAFGGRVITVQGDIGDYVCVENMFKTIFKVFSSVDVLVNNAGISLVKPLMDTTPEEWRSIIATNLDSVYNTTRFVLPKMSENGFGRIINISSVWGESGASCEVAYSASKAALHGFTRALAKEVPSGITVNCIAPGIIDTDMNSDLSISEVAEFLKCVPASRMGNTSEVAELVKFLASDSSGYINGQVIGINGGMA